MKLPPNILVPLLPSLGSHGDRPDVTWRRIGCMRRALLYQLLYQQQMPHSGALQRRW